MAIKPPTKAMFDRLCRSATISAPRTVDAIGAALSNLRALSLDGHARTPR
jgi:hypothetical protein